MPTLLILNGFGGYIGVFVCPDLNYTTLMSLLGSLRTASSLEYPTADPLITHIKIVFLVYGLRATSTTDYTCDDMYAYGLDVLSGFLNFYFLWILHYNFLM